MLKIIAILLNITFFLWFLYMSITDGFGRVDVWDILTILILFLLPIINILALIYGKDNYKDNWITYYFKRKTMEEKRKITEIENEMK